VLHTPILGKIKNNSKKDSKNLTFFEIKDEYWYCTYKKYFPRKLLLFFPG
jgi:hypothetical protein